MKIERQIGALARLKEQLVQGTKTKNVDNSPVLFPLTDKDRVRINKEISILESRIPRDRKEL